jgi:hypothetical protein
MLMSHNSLDQEIEFFISFLHSAIKGDQKYNAVIKPLLEDAKSLANGKSVYDLDKSALNLKIMIDTFAHDWLLKVDISNVSPQELSELESIINDNKNYAIA